MSKQIGAVLAAGALALSFAATAQEKGKGIGALEYAKATATVESVDQATREVTLKDAQGGKVSFVAGPDVKNLAQVSKGDIVTIEYAQAVLVALEKSKSAKRERLVSEAKKGAPLGSMPAGVMVREVKVVASVEAVDTANSAVTLRGPENTVTVKVKDPAVLAKVKAGDFVQATYTEALAVRVDKAPAAAAAPKAEKAPAPAAAPKK